MRYKPVIISIVLSGTSSGAVLVFSVAGDKISVEREFQASTHAVIDVASDRYTAKKPSVRSCVMYVCKEQRVVMYILYQYIIEYIQMHSLSFTC